MKTIIRKATKRDFKQIAEIIKKEYGKKPYYEVWEEKDTLKTLTYYSKVGKIYVAVVEKEVVGVIITRQEFYNGSHNIIIEELVVNSKKQGKGIGKEMMEYVEVLSKKKKVKAINLFASKKAKAYNFYKKIGYKHDKNFVSFSKRLK